MWKRKRGSFVLNCRFAVFLTPNWLVEFASWREKLNYDHELFGFSYELFSRCSENRNFLSCNSNRNFKFNFILFNFFQSLWLHRAHVEDTPHLYVLFNIFFFYWKKPLRTIISPILMAGVSFEFSCLKISQKLEKKWIGNALQSF